MTIDTPHTSALHVQGLRFRYASGGDWIIDIPELTLTPGQQVLMTGGSGRGKSTLLHLIAGLVEPNAGSIEINGRNIHQIGQAERDRFRGREIGMIFQTFNLLHGFTALENVMTALMFSQFPRNEHRTMASALLEHLGIERPGAQPHELSVGQQQRVAVARAVACRPALVLADEPTASLDPENAQTAITLIQQSCAEVGAALLCTSHDPSLIDRFEHRVSLDELSQAQAA